MAREILVNLSIKMKTWRETIGISQKKAAAVMGICQSTWNKYETGKIIGGDAVTVQKINELILEHKVARGKPG